MGGWQLWKKLHDKKKIKDKQRREERDKKIFECAHSHNNTTEKARGRIGGGKAK